jgi:hypothetical protein
MRVWILEAGTICILGAPQVRGELENWQSRSSIRKVFGRTIRLKKGIPLKKVIRTRLCSEVCRSEKTVLIKVDIDRRVVVKVKRGSHDVPADGQTSCSRVYREKCSLKADLISP